MQRLISVLAVLLIALTFFTGDVRAGNNPVDEKW